MIIIGAGPGGMGAAIYAKRAGMDVLVIDKNPMSGGQVLSTYEVDNYLGLPGLDGFSMGMKFKEHADYLGIAMVNETVSSIYMEDSVKKVVTDNRVYEAKTLILAMGANHRTLGVPGEAEFVGSGVSYCATCDGAFFRGKSVAVVGGGDVAAEDALYLAKFCEKVYLIHRRDSLRAAKSLQDKLFQNEKIQVIWNRVVEQIKGQGKVEELVLRNGQNSPMTASKEQEENQILSVDGVFIAVGISPNNQLVSEQVACDQSGYIKAGEDCLTSVPGVAVVGDLRTKQLRQIITAVADGANAVASLESYIV